jgi:hypothetical protein
MTDLPNLHLIAESRLTAAIQAEEYTLIATLKPRIFVDGDQWCVLWGENLQDGIAGFGESPTLAVYDFNKAWHKKLPKKVATEMANKDRALSGGGLSVEEVVALARAVGAQRVAAAILALS